ncbi:lytic transglycosylase domain-containing protein [Oecophyllibacter saccharovorans]|uniref:lytic transglycosylase domain-containing protein n=1 Tax=Oecophyllibacter saccharovorans TaxID=2558360 RepID=UPI00116C82A6|nr:lytic transglycosylase domain-containing protein [Oecophyllibacter saccharovorans]TPW34630.1 lytic transglycosylase domain-containing protein [Oecophyllibacter saccharovorans]
MFWRNRNRSLFVRLMGIGLVLSAPLQPAWAAPIEGNPAQNMSLASRLAEWQVLTGPQGGHFPAARYGNFLRDKPDWPLLLRIQWRFEEALKHEQDPTVLQAFCPVVPLRQVDSLLACTAYLPDGAEQARKLWRYTLDEATAARLSARFGSDLTAEDQWQRFLWLESHGALSNAARHIMDLAPEQQPLARLRLSLRQGGNDVADLYQQLSPQQQSDEALTLLRLQVLRRSQATAEALQLWEASGLPVQTELEDITRRKAWTKERNALMRLLLQQGDAGAAFKLAGDTTLPPAETARQDNGFLSAYAALRLNQPDRAKQFLKPLQAAPSLSARAQALHWLAQAEAAAGKKEKAQDTLQAASRYPTTFYGQFSHACLTHTPYLTASQRDRDFLAGLQSRLGDLSSPDPAPLARQDLADAAEILTAEGNKAGASLFLTWLVLRAETAGELHQAAREADKLGNAKGAILAGRALARQGQTLYPLAYPLPYEAELFAVPESQLPPELIAALVRQESSGDPKAVSPAQAYGLMQLRPPTARQVSRLHRTGQASTPAALQDPRTNLLLGRLYLQDLSRRFEDRIPYFLAAYNAGPRRTRQWLAEAPGSTFTGGLCQPEEMNLLGWIELLPADETRHYIEHIETDYSLYTLKKDRLSPP